MNGFFSPRTQLNAGEIGRFRELMEVRGRIWRMTRGFAAVDFEDGCDTLFIRIITSEDSVDVAGRAAEDFERINRTRRQVLIGLRHVAVEGGVALIRSGSGLWQYQQGCVTGSIWVGAALTELAQDLAPAEALLALLKRTCLLKVDAEKALILVGHAQPPAEEVRWRKDDEIEPLFGPGILALDCSKSSEWELTSGSAAEIADQLAPTRNSSGQLVLNAIVDRVGRYRFSVDLLGKGGADIAFTDGLDDFRIFPQSKRLKRLIESHGIEGAVEHVVADFKKLDRARAETLSLVQRVMTRNGYYLDDTAWCFGRTHREYPFPTGRELTLRLRDLSPLDVVGAWLQRFRPIDPLPGAEELKKVCEDDSLVPRRKPLPACDPADGAARLPTFGAFNPSAVDERAFEVIRATIGIIEKLPRYGRLFEQLSPFKIWSCPLWYRRGRDVWTSEEWWVEVAARHWSEHEDQLAALVLMVNGHSEPRSGLLRMARDLEAWCGEALEETVLWPLADELPWPVDFEDVLESFPGVLGSPPPQLARHHSVLCRECLIQSPDSLNGAARDPLMAMGHAARLDDISAREWLSAEEISELRQVCLDWATLEEDPNALRQDAPLAVAAHFRWPEVIDALNSNLRFVAAQYEQEELLLEPGMVALRLSLANPGELSARFAAHALMGNFEDVTNRQLDCLAGSVDQQMRESLRSSLLDSRRLDQFAGAIAWSRCRGGLNTRRMT